eukprot:TRINITY_DN58745_c0_g1_i2.p3 TRINITY_DN58745_c0_g1~~TRINITY_DN58745_c0_g1_i2.p3  ORF type:complete len:105 (+),score=21.93 TRINITY_DN58745_c0_g1_i2:33-347(+)
MTHSAYIQIIFLYYYINFVISVFIFFFFFFNDTATTEIYTRSIVGSVRCVQETGAALDRQRGHQAGHWKEKGGYQVVPLQYMLPPTIQNRKTPLLSKCYLKWKL